MYATLEREELGEVVATAELKTCKRCFGHYVMTDRDRKWYKTHNMHEPEHCPVCRKERRQ